MNLSSSMLPQCVVVVWNMVDDLRKLIGDLPTYATQCLFLMVKLLSQFYTSIEQVYKSESHAVTCTDLEGVT